MADMSEAKQYIDKRKYTVQNGKGDGDRTSCHKTYRDNLAAIDWGKAKPLKFSTPTRPKVCKNMT